MAGFDEKENTAPLLLGHQDLQFGLSPLKQDDRKGRSKSIGPDALQSTRNALHERFQNVLNATSRGIIPDKEDAERKAARRKSMANRRVSFAPEATLHTWDVIEHMRDQTTSTKASDNLRGSPRKSIAEFGSPGPQSMSDDGSSEESGSEEEEEEEEDDATGTAMSFVTDAELTQASMLSGGGSSTSSSLDRNLRLAADTAGTRGIEYDEFGEMSMEIAGEEVTNAFQPWVQQQTDERRGSAAFDQENMLPFEFKAGGGSAYGDATEQDMSMDVTRVIGGILPASIVSSPFAEVPMDLITPPKALQSPASTGQKRRRSMTDNEDAFHSPASRSRQRLSTINELETTMDFTSAVGGIRVPSESDYDANEDLSMELTGVIGGIRGQIFGHTPQRMMEPSSPFRIDVDDTVAKPGATPLPTNDDQSPTPRAKSVVSARRASGRTRQSSTAEPETPAVSSPAQRRSSRLSARSPSQHETPRLIEPLVDAETSATPVQSIRRSPRGLSRSPSQQAKTPPPAASQVRIVTPNAVRPAVLSFTPEVVGNAQIAVRTPSQPTAQLDVMSTPKTATEIRSMMDNIKLMTTPRKEVLKVVTPKKATPSPSKRPRSVPRSQQRQVSTGQTPHPELVQLAQQNEVTSGVSLQDFLDQAGIRFMDLTTSKRRLTIATTPSRLRKTIDQPVPEDETLDVTLDEAIVAASCTEPELELYKHACHELKRYIDEGKADTKVLEAETMKETPVLIQAYISAGAEQRDILDAHMRDIKTNARLRSKEMWYGWRSNLIDDLMKALGSIAEDLLADDEFLRQKETLLSTMMPLQEQRASMQAQVEELTAAMPRAEEKAELDSVRARLQEKKDTLSTKQQLLQQLQEQMTVAHQQREELQEIKDEYLLTIKTAENKRASDQMISGDQVSKLKGAVVALESDYEWSIISASADPPVVTMSYKSQLELYFHPGAFNTAEESNQSPVNAPISLRYVGETAISTTTRFFLQVLQAYIQAVVQSTTKINEMLNLVASTWESALQLVETKRQLAIEAPVTVSILNDECLICECFLLLPKVRTKVCATLTARVSLEQGNECDLTTDAKVAVVYGEPYNEKGMSEFLKTRIADGFESWPSAIQQLRQKLIERGPKGEVTRS